MQAPSMRARSRGDLASAGLLVISALGAAACSPTTYSTPTAAAPATVFDCAMRIVTSGGFTVTSSDRAAGVLRAVDGGQSITVNAVAEANGATLLNVKAAENTVNANGAPIQLDASASTKTVASNVVSVCGGQVAPTDSTHRDSTAH